MVYHVCSESYLGKKSTWQTSGNSEESLAGAKKVSDYVTWRQRLHRVNFQLTFGMATTGTFGLDKVGIAHLLKNTNVVVPQYQRSYAWEDRHVIEFLDDIERAVKGEVPEYFLGSLVLAETDVKGLPEVVDGQQRLATTTILIA